MAGQLFSFDGATRGYTFDVRSPINEANFVTRFLPADIVASGSNARTTLYERSEALDSPLEPARLALRLFNVSPLNDQLVLTYSSFGLLDIRTMTGAFFSRDFRAFAYYAQVTPDAAVPRTGMSTFTGRALGAANPTSADGGPRYAVTGTITIVVDWAARTYTVTLIPTFQEDENASASAIGASIAASRGTTPTSFSQFSGVVTGQSAPNGFLAMLAGPAAEEMAGTMTFRSVGPTRPDSPPIDVVVAFSSRR